MAKGEERKAFFESFESYESSESSWMDLSLSLSASGERARVP